MFFFYAMTHGCSPGSWVAESRPSRISLREKVELVDMTEEEVVSE